MNKWLDLLIMGLLGAVLIAVTYWWIILIAVFIGCILQGGDQMALTKARTHVSDFLFNIYLESDSDELDKWLAWLALMNGDKKLAEAMDNNED